MADQPKPAKRPDPKYVVQNSQVGAFAEGAVFGRSDFAKLYPLPDTPATRDAGLVAAGEDQYHDDLLARLVANGSIRQTDPAAESTPVEIGPENRGLPVARPAPQPARVASDDAAQRDATATQAGQRATDAADRKASPKGAVAEDAEGGDDAVAARQPKHAPHAKK